MTQVITDMTISLDGYAAGPHQSRDNPFGEGVGERLHRWMFEAADENVEEIAAITAAGAYVRAARRSRPSPTESSLRWRRRARPPARRTSRSPAAPGPSTSISPRASSTSCGCTSRR
jgi:hypothetical protein